MSNSLLDRALFSQGFASLWSNIVTHALPRLTSDHSPLVMICRADSVQGRRSFKFLNMWVSHPNFQDLVTSSWEQRVDINCQIFRVMFKLRRLRSDLRNWNKTVFGNVDTQIEEGQRRLSVLQNDISSTGYTDDLFDAEVAEQASLGTLLDRKCNLLQQKSRANWLNDGDRNSSFFHRLIKFRKRPQRIEHLKIEGNMVYDQSIIQDHIIDFFSNLFREEGQRTVDRVMLEAIIDEWVTEEQNDTLTRIPDDAEIAAAVFGMDSNSAPGPDGFSGSFFQNCWSIIKADVVVAIRAFFLKNYLPAGCNASTLILIPKKEAVDTVADLRPIILSNFFFKIISKILATRLGAIASRGVSQNQFGFISGRSIHDCIVMGSEGFSCMNRTGRRSNMACKVLRVNGFNERFIQWISIIFNSARISILYNGQLSGYFACSRGVRQGDPLSPIIFGIAEDVLSHLFSNCVRSGHLVPMDYSRATHFPTHLLYADDILIFCKASVKNARKIKEILELYGDLSGQICSPEKSRVFFSEKVQPGLRHGISRCMGFSLGELPVIYLGVPLFVGRIKASYFDAIHDRIIQKFARWKGLHLSMAAWRLVKGKDLMAATLSTRYLNSFGHAKNNIGSSPFWTSVRDHVTQLVDDSYSLIGVGAATMFWCDDWLGYRLTDKLKIPCYMFDFLTQAVDEYFFDGIWHFSEDFIINFPDVVIDILLLPIGGDEDTRFWKHSVSGEVTSATAYSHTSQDFPKVLWGNWIWERFIPERRSIVCWRVIHQRLPTVDNLIRRGIQGPNRCALCGKAEESINHLFWDCEMIKPIWGEFLYWFQQEDLKHCVDIHSFMVSAWSLDSSSLIKAFWKAGIVNILWKIWDCRNHVIFDDLEFNIIMIRSFIKVSFREMDRHFKKLGNSNNTWSDYLILRSIGVATRAKPPPIMIEVYWWPPAVSWMKVNTDGSAHGAPGSIAAGGVFRDSWGWVRGCFHFKGGRGFAFEAELLAVIHAISIAHNRGWFSLWVEADSEYMVRLLQERSMDVPWRFIGLWKQAIMKISDFNMQVSHIYREGNRAADIMANQDREEGWWPFAIEEIKLATNLDMATHSAMAAGCELRLFAAQVLRCLCLSQLVT
ncbi:uncharacterized protein LOC130990686 [Salvia miltiorrhiza]|uniref:uncharacterized protein LOC130990686 n=1 Tax=Salvia miltiorrhiza TaxID=226208 RepID=UPI0025AD7A55|nr:uncharacterized protein LOC130990686 [Salvia miltiorrhiza]